MNGQKRRIDDSRDDTCRRQTAGSHFQVVQIDTFTVSRCIGADVEQDSLWRGLRGLCRCEGQGRHRRNSLRLRPLQVGNTTDQQGKGTGLKELQVTNWHGVPISEVCGAQIPWPLQEAPDRLRGGGGRRRLVRLYLGRPKYSTNGRKTNAGERIPADVLNLRRKSERRGMEQANGIFSLTALFALLSWTTGAVTVSASKTREA